MIHSASPTTADSSSSWTIHTPFRTHSLHGPITPRGPSPVGRTSYPMDVLLDSACVGTFFVAAVIGIDDLAKEAENAFFSSFALGR